MALMMKPKPKTKKESGYGTQTATVRPVRIPKLLDLVMEVIVSQQEQNAFTEKELIKLVKESLQVKQVKCGNVTMQVRRSIQYGLLKGFLKQRIGKYSIDKKQYARYQKIGESSDQDFKEVSGNPGTSKRDSSPATKTSSKTPNRCHKKSPPSQGPKNGLEAQSKSKRKISKDSSTKRTKRCEKKSPSNQGYETELASQSNEKRSKGTSSKRRRDERSLIKMGLQGRKNENECQPKSRTNSSGGSSESKD